MPVTPALECLAEKVFARTVRRAVDVCGVEERDAGVKSRVDDGTSAGQVEPAPDLIAAKANGRHGQAGVTKLAVRHVTHAPTLRNARLQPGSGNPRTDLWLIGPLHPGGAAPTDSRHRFASGVVVLPPATDSRHHFTSGVVVKSDRVRDFHDHTGCEVGEQACA